MEQRQILLQETIAFRRKDQANFHRNRHPGRVTFTEAEKEEAYLNGHCTNTAQIKDY